MTLKDRRKIRKIIASLKVYCDEYAKANDTAMASKFSRAIAMLIDILDEDAKESAINDS